MTEERKRLMTLICEAHNISCNAKLFDDATYAQQLGKEADHLLANGVTFATDNNDGCRWIPVTERLPEKDGKFLVHRIIYGGVSTMAVVGFARNGKKVHEFDLRKHKNVWYDYDSEAGYYPLTTVTHWMPLPEKPKEE